MRPPYGFYTYPFSHGLLASLAHHLLTACGPNTPCLSQRVILLPTRRSARLLTQYLHEQSPSPVFLPQMFTFGDLPFESIEFLRALQILPCATERALLSSLPLPIPPLKASLLIMPWLKGSYEKRKERLDFLSLSSLSHLLLSTYALLNENGLSLSHIESQIPDMHALHWSNFADLLKEFWRFWPNCLKTHHHSDLGAYKKAQLDHLCHLVCHYKTNTPVYIITPKGLSLGLRTLFKSLASLSCTTTVLEGDPDELLPPLDPLAPEKDWPSPYAEQQLFLRSHGPTLPHLQSWDFSSHPPLPGLETHHHFKKSLSTENPQRSLSQCVTSQKEDSGQSLTYWEADTLLEEAQFIALKLRKILSTPGKTAALITPSRDLARRVTEELLYFGITPDDSFGTPLTQTSLGQLLLLSLECVIHDFKASSLHALLCHPLCHLGFDADRFQRAHSLLEKHFLRGLTLTSGLISYKKRIQKSPSALSLSHSDRSLMLDLLEKLEASFTPLTGLLKKSPKGALTLTNFFDAHKTVVENLLGPSPTPRLNDLFQTIETSLTPFRTLLDHTPFFSIDAYKQTLLSYLSGVTHPQRPTHPEISILGLLEGRLVSVDSMILGGLNEDVWDRALTPHPWLNQSLRHGLSLETNKTIQGQMFQEFLTHLCHPNVCLTRSKRTSEGIQKPSRFFLQAKIKGLTKRCLTEDGDAPLVKILHRTPAFFQATPPCPSPDIHKRPRNLYVTDIATLIDNPYAFYVTKILKLKPLRHFEEEPSPQDMGIWVHKLVEQWGLHKNFSVSEVIQTLKTSYPFRDLPPSTQFFLLQKMTPLLQEFTQTHHRRTSSSGSCKVLVEVPVEMPLIYDFQKTSGPLTLTGRIDRLELDLSPTDDPLSPPSILIIDYKTGTIPSHKSVHSGRAPQLPLLGFLLSYKMNLSDLRGLEACFWSLTPENSRLIPISNFHEAIDETILLLEKRLTTYYGDNFLPFKALQTSFDPFPTLSRQQEWSGVLTHFFQGESVSHE